MATKTINFDQVTIGSNDYSKHLTESASVTLEPVTTTVEDGQTLVDAYDVTFEVKLYDSTVEADSNVYTDATGSPNKTSIIFGGVTGALTLTIADVYVNGVREYDENRSCVRLFGTKRAISLATATTEA